MILRKMSSWSVSLSLHLAGLLVLGAFWVIQVAEVEADVYVVRPPRRVERREPVCFERPKTADDHPPIVPKEFVPADVVNTAIEVVENTWPENEIAQLEPAPFPALAHPAPVNGASLNHVVGLGGGGGGAYAKRFG